MTKYIYKLISFISIYSILIISQNFTSLTYADGITYDDKIAYESEKQVTSEVNPYSLFSQKLIEKINKDADNLGIKWVKGGMQSFSEYNFSGFIVLNETLKKLSFLQGNFTYDSNNGKTLNIGLGHRTLVDVSPEFKDFVGGKEAMLEINTFYDLKSSQDGLLSSSNLFSSSHSRHSFGLRLSTPKYDFYGNLYQRGQNTFINDERVLSGHDFGFSGRIPKDDNLKLNLKRYNFSSDFNRKSGVKLRAEYFLTPHLSFGGEYDNSDQNNSSEELFINFTYNFGEKLNQRVNTTPSATKVWDKRYDEVIRENKVYLEKRLVITTITPPTTLSGNLGGNVDVSLNTGNGRGYDSSTMGAVTYAIKNRGNVTGASISGRNLDLSSATISPAAASAIIEIRATIAANDQYAETVVEYNVEINLAEPEYDDIVNLIKELNAGGGTASDNPNLDNAPASYNSDEHGARTFTITSATDNVPTSIISVSNDGAVTLPANTGATEVTVKVSTPGGTKYAAGFKEYTVTFTKIDAPDLLFDDPSAQVAWGEEVSAVTPTTESGYNKTQMGTLSYAGTVTGISVATNGTVTATQPGSVTVKVSTAGGTKYKAGEVGAYDVKFTKKDIISVSGQENLSGNLGSSDTVDASLSGYDSGTMGTVRYEIKGDKKGATINNSSGAVNLSNATGAGTITIKATIAPNDLYNEKIVEYNVEINEE